MILFTLTRKQKHVRSFRRLLSMFCSSRSRRRKRHDSATTVFSLHGAVILMKQALTYTSLAYTAPALSSSSYPIVRSAVGSMIRAASTEYAARKKTHSAANTSTSDRSMFPIIRICLSSVTTTTNSGERERERERERESKEFVSRCPNKHIPIQCYFVVRRKCVSTCTLTHPKASSFQKLRS